MTDRIPDLPDNTTKELSNEDPLAPDCPHCGACMDEAPLTLGDLAEALAYGSFANDTTGIMNGHKVGHGVAVNCPSCGKYSAVAVKREVTFNWPGWHMRLAPFWTKRDAVYIETHLMGPDHPAWKPAAQVSHEYLNGPGIKP